MLLTYNLAVWDLVNFLLSLVIIEGHAGVNIIVWVMDDWFLYIEETQLGDFIVVVMF